GAERVGVHQLRSTDDSTLLRAALQAGGRRVVVIGSGWIGLEVAAAARGYGNTVTVLGRGAVPLGRVLGEEAAEVFADLHRENEVELWMHSDVTEILGDDHGVTGVRLATGEELSADLVVVGLGAIPNVLLAQVAGLDVADGIRVDAAFQTSDAAVYAVGDVASVFHPVLGEHHRVDHWANANTAPAFAARAMLGQTVCYDEIPYFFTDQFDLGMEYSGYPSLASTADLVLRGDRPGRSYVAFWLKDLRVVAGMNVNVWEVNDTVQQLIRSGVRVDPARLADPAVPLAEILAEAEAEAEAGAAPSRSVSTTAGSPRADSN
ncbi:MAG: FAD-dependent oxidoreductase, partial [Cryobacterium sp.]